MVKSAIRKKKGKKKRQKKKKAPWTRLCPKICLCASSVPSERFAAYPATFFFHFL